MDNLIKGRVIKTIGWVTVGVGFYMIHKGVLLENTIEHVVKEGVIDAVFEVVEEGDSQ